MDVRRTPCPSPVDLRSDPRLQASMDRLLQPDYAVDRVMAQTTDSDWPGDLAGRLLLALARFARAGAPTTERATALNAAMLDALRDHGYIGPVVGEVVPEQQVACHGWVASGLLQHYYATGDARSREAAIRVVDELLLPAVDRLCSYPRERDLSAEIGEAAGTATVISGGWAVSSDIWCVLLVLNGLVPVALETDRADIHTAIATVAEALAALDLRGQHVQLHASLAAARCLADYAEAVPADWTVRLARDVYDTYARHARTLNYATYNWFERPDSWTETCAIVDSLGCAGTLDRLTGEPRYRDDAVRIAYWGLNFAERRDGSFGLDSVTTPKVPVLTPQVYDAWWCCTLRGPIGLLEARETGIWPTPDPPELGDLLRVAGTFGPDDHPSVHLFVEPA